MTLGCQSLVGRPRAAPYSASHCVAVERLRMSFAASTRKRQQRGWPLARQSTRCAARLRPWTARCCGRLPWRYLQARGTSWLPSMPLCLLDSDLFLHTERWTSDLRAQRRCAQRKSQRLSMRAQRQYAQCTSHRCLWRLRASLWTAWMAVDRSRASLRAGLSGSSGATGLLHGACARCCAVRRRRVRGAANFYALAPAM
jgi:hypothetical protein